MTIEEIEKLAQARLTNPMMYVHQWNISTEEYAKAVLKLVTKVRAAEELAQFIDDRLGNHALVVNQGDEPDKLRTLLQTYGRAGK